MIEESITFQNSKNMRLNGVLRVPFEGAESLPTIILCHGFMTHKDDLLINYLFYSLSARGFAVLKFDFSHHGESEGDIRDLTITQQVDDLKSAIAFLQDDRRANSARIGILAHSIGGSVAIMASAENDDVRALATLNATAHILVMVDTFLTDNEMLDWRKTGSALIKGNEINKTFLKDAERHNVLDYVDKIVCPFLIIHALADRRVNYSNAREIFGKANMPKEIHFIENANHDFTEDEHRAQILELVLSWFNRYIKNG